MIHIDDLCVAIREQSVIGAADEELVELGSGHHPANGGAKGGRSVQGGGVK